MERDDWLGPVLVGGVVGLIVVGHLLGGGFARCDSTLLAALALLATAAFALARGTTIRSLYTPTLAAAGLLVLAPIAVGIIQMLAPGFDHEGALAAAVQLVGLAGMFLIGAFIGVDRLLLLAFTTTSLIAANLFALLAFAGFTCQWSGVCAPEPFLDPARLSFTLRSPNSAAAVFAIALAMTVTLLFLAGDRKAPAELRGSRALWVLMFGSAFLNVVALLLTQSRFTAVLGLAACLAIAVSHISVTRHRWAAYLGAAVVALGFIGGVVASGRLAAAPTDLAARQAIYSAHAPTVLDRPWLGHGFGGFIDVNRQVMTEANYTSLYNTSAMHNVYLQWLEQAGVIASGAMGLAILLILTRIARKGDRQGSLTGVWRKIALAVAAILLLQGVFDLALEHYSIDMAFALTLGVAYGATRLQRVRKRRFGRRREADEVEDELAENHLVGG